ncbi:MAG: hypothetical protein A3J97_01095 [Spirochaetes bacterium RIFOXYC1_FULL_54_7]|nr:MAG: hypothetical protein A3J97_01095 [Spirochaetes bacterium RIFOXYC1_FULL_54_7]
MIPRIDKLSSTLILFVVLALVVFVGCTKPEPVTFNLDTTPILSGGLGWAVVSGAYVRLKAEPGFGTRDGDYARRGDILQVVATERAFSGRDRGTWYRLEGDGTSGWLHQSLMSLYPSRERALSAAEAAR